MAALLICGASLGTMVVLATQLLVFLRVGYWPDGDFMNLAVWLNGTYDFFGRPPNLLALDAARDSWLRTIVVKDWVGLSAAEWWLADLHVAVTVPLAMVLAPALKD